MTTWKKRIKNDHQTKSQTKMNKRLLVCLVLIGLIRVAVRAEDPKCDDVAYEACYFKTGDENGVVERGKKIPISKANFLMGAKIVMEQPLEFKENVYGNPFPMISIAFYAKQGKVARNFYFKIKNAHKNAISKTEGASLLEGNFEYPYLIITIPFSGNTNLDKRPFVVSSDVIKTVDGYLYSNFKKIPMNSYVDMFKNEVEFDFSSVSVDSLVQRDNSTAYREDMFKYNLRPYERTCAEVRMDNNQTAEAFKKEALDRVKEQDAEIKSELKNMKITDFLRRVNYLNKMGSFCGEIIEAITSDASCLRANPNKCESFLRVEKISDILYQFHLFTRKRVSYVTMAFLNAKNLKTQLEIVCERGKEFLEYTLVVDDKRTPAGPLLKAEHNINASLIYSTRYDILYCGVRMPFNMPLVIGNTELKFDLTNQSILYLDFGVYSTDLKTKVPQSHTQFPLDFNFANELNLNWELTTFVLFGLVGGFVIILCLAVSGWILKKYNSLSRRLTEAGSHISNLSLVSNAGSNVPLASQASTASRVQTGVRSEIMGPEDLNSSMASRFGRNIDQNIVSMKSDRSQTGSFSNRAGSPRASSPRASSPNAALRSSSRQNQRRSSASSQPASSRSKSIRSKAPRHNRP